MASIPDLTFHELVNAAMASNRWEYPYACGYVSGRCDRTAGRPSDHRPSENDDYAKGYHKGYNQP